MLAEEEPLLVSPPTHDVAMHVHDYTRFTKMMARGAIVFFATALIVLLIIS